MPCWYHLPLKVKYKNMATHFKDDLERFTDEAGGEGIQLRISRELES